MEPGSELFKKESDPAEERNVAIIGKLNGATNRFRSEIM